MSITGAKHFKVKVDTASRALVSIDDFAYPENKIMFLFGESGIGKTMISKAIYGLLDPGELTINVNGRPYLDHINQPWVKSLKANSFFVFQEPSSHLNPLMTLNEQMNEGTLSSADQAPILKSLWQGEPQSKIDEILALFPKPFRPSGGEKQRILLAMAFKKIQQLMDSKSDCQPNLFAFDEPTGSLDNAYRNLFIRMLLKYYKQKSFTILFITHDYSVISQLHEHHQDLWEHFNFKELYRKQDAQVALRDFSPDIYLSWLKGMNVKAEVPKTATTPIVKVEENFSIFNRSFRVLPSGSGECGLCIRRGETAYLKAPSGTGKTTLAKIIMGLYRPQVFKMDLGGIEVNEKTSTQIWSSRIWGKKAGMVFQHADESLNLEATVQETFSGLPIKPALSPKNIQEHLALLFKQGADTAFLNKKVAHLSGGQKQRLNLLRTLVLGTEFIILDEPLNGLDFDSIQRVLDILARMGRAGCAFLMISHNEEIFGKFIAPDKVYHLEETQ